MLNCITELQEDVATFINTNNKKDEDPENTGTAWAKYME